ncbi:hypothetical protein DICPUDRAFT_57393 [Dictyostelium purpureum]|uniref:Condensin complex subunit 1 C-terminal domain-containing protein n=1 Tax=Dictyostelium purpureum TaxID=5786 RepID=F0ZVR9_DICPU|nr:uncharacterized protein DICPUDRAFT_57393 [Dictyostelium purpureum]EGC31967.1 hypothetical protein DICPUDRAFT_57393 [Dictyostelium purpureum]|eukprot:XP_003291503.1 hypothetical protein DICPUDRAFT_57393 [Dictyostelium purpureum]
MSTSNEIINCINESFISINTNDNLEQDSVAYLSGLISECESFEELKEQFSVFCKEFEIISNEQEVEDVFNTLVALLKRKGLISFNIEKSKPHLVCTVNPNAEPKLDDPNLTMEQYLSLTRSSDSRVRLLTLRSMCPCKVKADIDQLWDRIIEMSQDDDPKVRYQAMHNLCDGSPIWREESVIRALEGMHNDKNAKIRRRIHNILVHYKHTGKWNIM